MNNAITGNLLFAAPLLWTVLCLVPKTMARVTFDLPPATTVVLHLPFSAEVACRVRTAARLLWSLVSAWRASDGRPAIVIVSLLVVRPLCLTCRLSLPHPVAADPSRGVLHLQSQILCDLLHRRSRHVYAIRLDVPVVDAAVTKGERRRVVGELYGLLRAERNKPRVHCVDRVTGVFTRHRRADARDDHLSRLHLRHLKQLAVAVNDRGSRGWRSGITIIPTDKQGDAVVSAGEGLQSAANVRNLPPVHTHTTSVSYRFSFRYCFLLVESSVAQTVGKFCR